MHECLSFGDSITYERINDGIDLFEMKDEHGEGRMRMVSILNGVCLQFNDFHMKKCESKLNVDARVFCIDHCREGRIEHQLRNGIYSYLSPGDLRIDDRSYHYTTFDMPLAHYHGITIAFFIEEAEQSIREAFPGFPVDLSKLHEKYCRNKDPFVIRNEAHIEHIFSELYKVPACIKEYYYKIKIFELLLFLDALELSDHQQSAPYFYKTQVEKIKSIQKLITDNVENHYTLEELSDQFDIPLTSMKNCFKGVYGTTIYSYIRSCRMNRAAVLLKTTDFSVARIAGDVGYNSPSKFAAAFRQVMMSSPLDYRKSLV